MWYASFCSPLHDFLYTSRYFYEHQFLYLEHPYRVAECKAAQCEVLYTAVTMKRKLMTRVEKADEMLVKVSQCEGKVATGHIIYFQARNYNRQWKDDCELENLWRWTYFAVGVPSTNNKGLISVTTREYLTDWCHIYTCCPPRVRDCKVSVHVIQRAFSASYIIRMTR